MRRTRKPGARAKARRIARYCPEPVSTSYGQVFNYDHPQKRYHKR
jgi:hypothetical protein